MIDETTKIIKGSLRYQSAPETNYSVNIPLTQTQEELVEFDRNVDISLEQVYNDERQKSTTFRPVSKFTILFKNNISGSTKYEPYKNNLYYTNALNNTIQTFPGGNIPPQPPNLSVEWQGFPQYFEFDFIREDNDVPGYSQPPNKFCK